MPNVGRASLDCHSCRARRIKCDLTRPSCRCCLKIGKPCPGYRDPLDVIFKIESGVHTRDRRRRPHQPDRPDSSESPKQECALDENGVIKTNPTNAWGASLVPAFLSGATPKCDIDTPNVWELYDHCNREMLPSLRRSKTWTAGYMNEFAVKSANRLVLYSICFASSVHLSPIPQSGMVTQFKELSPVSRSEVEQLHYKGLTLKMLRQAVSDQKTSIEDILFSIFLLALHENLDTMARPDSNPFQHQLMNLDNLQFYGACIINPAHWRAVEALVARAGLHTLKAFGLAWSLSCASLKHAMIQCARPSFPILDINGKMVIPSRPLKSLGITSLPHHRTEQGGFRSLKNFKIRPLIIRTLLDLTELCQAMQYVLARTDDSDLVDQWADARNTTQYWILCLPRDNEPKDILSHDDKSSKSTNTVAEHIYDAVWLTTYLFTGHVTFPLPRCYRIREDLVFTLRRAIAQSTQLLPVTNEKNKPMLGMMVWCTMIGGILSADVDSTLFKWYLLKFRELCLVLQIESWSSVRGLLLSFAWVETACDGAGLEFWLQSRTQLQFDAN